MGAAFLDASLLRNSVIGLLNHNHSVNLGYIKGLSAILMRDLRGS